MGLFLKFKQYKHDEFLGISYSGQFDSLIFLYFSCRHFGFVIQSLRAFRQAALLPVWSVVFWSWGEGST